MKKSLFFSSLLAVLTFALVSSVNPSKTFVLTTVSEGPILPNSPFSYDDIEVPLHLFDPSDSIGYGGRILLDSMVFDAITNDGATLGRVLFYDKKLSALENISCASCHKQELSFTENKRFSEGISSPTKRNSMHLNDLGWSNREHFAWNMEKTDFHEMIVLPLTDENEIGANIDDVRLKLEATNYYPDLFEKAYGDSEITEERVVDALVQFISSMHSLNSRLDEQIKDGFSDFTEQESHGMQLFSAHCGTCHQQGAHAPFGEIIFVDDDILNFFPFIFNNGLAEDENDLGAGEWQNGMDHLFKIPTLRNIEVTGPYMHDGQFTTLEEVIDHYSDGIEANEWTGVFLPPEGFQFNESEKQALLAFMKTFTDESFLTNERWSDPFVEELNTEENLSIESISLMPNPTSDRAQIRFKNDNNDIVSINIFDTTGKLVKHDRTISSEYIIEKEEFGNGLYYISMIMGDKKSTQKLIIQ